jgi:UDP-2,3-diacylglucosamine pyrophosphatase LpxH
MDLDGEKTWIFHGDVFDATTKGSAKLIAKLGGQGYDMLILLNRAINWLLKMVGKEKMSLSKKVKNSVKKAVSWISNFEQIAAELAIEKKYKNVICGHIHQPQIKEVKTEKGSVTYMNSGDWIENLTSLEYNQGKWEIFQYEEKEITKADISVFKKENKIPILDILTDEVAVFFNSMTATIQ